MTPIIRKCAFVLSALMAVSSASAQEDGLYDAAHPSDAVFVRWIGDGGNAQRQAFGHDFDLSPDQATAYAVISNAALTGATPATYYTVIDAADAPARVIAEPARDDKSKVHLVLLNATTDPVRLMLAGTDREIITATPTDTAQARAVNPVSASVAVLPLDGGAAIGTFDLSLRRGQNVTIAVLETGVQVIENSFGPVIVAE